MNKGIIITGGTKGIGRAIVNLYADKGYEIFTCARSEADLEVLKLEMQKTHPGIKILSHVADVSDKQSVDDLVSFVKSSGINVDVLVNNAGVFIPGETLHEEEGTLEKMMETNLYSAYRITRGLLTNIIESKGHVFNMCSVASFMAYPNGGSYSISKFALLGYTKVLREEMKEKGVRVTAVMPGATYTSSWEGAGLPEERFMKATDVAHAIWSANSLSDHSVVEDIVIRPLLGDI